MGQKLRQSLWANKPVWSSTVNISNQTFSQNTLVDFFLLSWMEKCVASSTSFSELWPLEIGNIKEANVTGGLWAVLQWLPACECPFITRLVQISKGNTALSHSTEGAQHDFSFIVHGCMETALPLRAYRPVNRSSPDNNLTNSESD